MKKRVAYTIYGIMAAVVFLYWCFPSDKVADYIESTVTANNPDITLSIDSVKPGFPPGIRLNNLLLGFKDKPDSTLKADTMSVRPGFVNLLRGRLPLLFNAKTCEGNIKGNINFANLLSIEGPVSAKAKFKNINIGGCSYLKALIGRQITGKLKGSLIYNGNKDLINGEGSAEFVLFDGSIRLLQNMLGFDKLVFDAIEASMVLKNRTLKINKLKLAGEQLRGSLNGNIFLDNDIMQSRLAIKGNLEIPALSNKLSIIINGTIANPEAKFR